MAELAQEVEREAEQARRWSKGVRDAVGGCSAYDVLHNAFMLHLEAEIAMDVAHRAYAKGEISRELWQKYVNELHDFRDQLIGLPTEFNDQCECHRR